MLTGRVEGVGWLVGWLDVSKGGVGWLVGWLDASKGLVGWLVGQVTQNRFCAVTQNVTQNRSQKSL
jgi:hypothetical protein